MSEKQTTEEEREAVARVRSGVAYLAAQGYRVTVDTMLSTSVTVAWDGFSEFEEEDR